VADEQQMTFEEHSEIGEKLKYSYQHLEVVRAQLMSVYPKSTAILIMEIQLVLSGRSSSRP
jgi:hypothetical protein